MAEGGLAAKSELPIPTVVSEEVTSSVMQIETVDASQKPCDSNTGGDCEIPSEGDAGSKRERNDPEENKSENDSKKQKVDDESPGKGEIKEIEEEAKQSIEVKMEKEGPVRLGPKSFGSSVEMFDYFLKLIHHWPPNVNLNVYEYMVLLELLKKGHPNPSEKMIGGVAAFQIRDHPKWKNRCFFLIRNDESMDDFSFRKCVDCLIPLPDDMKPNPKVNKSLGGGGGRNRGRGGRGRGRN